MIKNIAINVYCALTATAGAATNVNLKISKGPV